MEQLKIFDYEYRILVYGSRNFTDTTFFHIKLTQHLNTILPEGMSPEERIKSIGFISGGASSGTDNMIINYANAQGYYCEKIYADWNKYKGRKHNPAGMIRNATLAECATYGIGFWDGISTGTANISERLDEKGIEYNVFRTRS